MITELKPYPVMKDSGVPWLGPVPEHWDVRKLKYAVAFSGGGTPSKGEASYWCGHIPWVSPKDMTGPSISGSADHITEEAVAASATSIVAPGALLMVVRSGILGRTLPVAINSVEVALNQDMKALRPQGHFVRSEYLRLLVQGNEAALIREWTKQGATVESIEHEYLASSRVPLPTLPEQAAIVRFLDHADRRIRRYIRTKQKLIKLLEEQKQAIIHRAVTRGLDANVRLKPSGAEWLGDVPEHWEVTRLKNAAAVQTGITLGKDYRSAVTKRYPYLRVANVQTGRVDLRAVKEINVPESDARRCMLRQGDVLMTEGGDIDKLGRGCVWDGQIAECLHQNHIFAVRCGPRLVPEFLVGLMASAHGRSYFQLTAKQTTNLAATNSTTLRAFPLFLPTVAEQKRILSSIAAGTRELECAVRDATREIALLREYRARLIADVVTGKLDVREAAARLPDEIGEPEPLDETDADVHPEDAVDYEHEAELEEANP